MEAQAQASVGIPSALLIPGSLANPAQAAIAQEVTAQPGQVGVNGHYVLLFVAEVAGRILHHRLADRNRGRCGFVGRYYGISPAEFVGPPLYDPFAVPHE